MNSCAALPKSRNYHLTIDLEQQSVQDAHGLSANFHIEKTTRHRLLHGLDDIGLTLLQESDIAAYEATHPVQSASKQL